jgi:hypothetical protein
MNWVQVNGCFFVTEVYELKMCIYGILGKKGTSGTDVSIYKS